MKPLKVLTAILAVIMLTGCVAQKQLDIYEILKKYNAVSGEKLDSEMFTVTLDEDYKYSYVKNGILLCFYCGTDGVINQCTVTAKNNEKAEFESVCRSIIMCFTDYTEEKSIEFLKEHEISDSFNLIIVENELGKTMILNKTTNELNSNEYPTLKRTVDEKSISRPTLGETQSDYIN